MPPPYPPTIPADIKRKFLDFDNLYDKMNSRVVSLESEARRLTAKGEELSKKDRELQQREEALTLRVKATFVPSVPLPSPPSTTSHTNTNAPSHSNLNATSRLSNSRLSSPHDILSPLHDLETNKAIKGFPKHEKDIRVMAPADVIAVLKALDTDVSGTAAERKARLRMGLGMEKEKLSQQNGEGAKKD